MKVKTHKYYDCALEYAQVFERNMDRGEGDNDAARTVAAKGGQTKVTMIVDEDTKDQMIADGVLEVSMGYEMFKGPDEDGNYRYVAKRPWNSPFKDEEGNPQPFGEPNVVDYVKSKEAGEQVPWDSEVNIGNDSTAKVRLFIWRDGKKGITRLESVGVVELVPYEGNGEVRF